MLLSWCSGVMLFIKTLDGILDHEEAIKRNLGGRFLGYFH